MLALRQVLHGGRLLGSLPPGQELSMVSPNSPELKVPGSGSFKGELLADGVVRFGTTQLGSKGYVDSSLSLPGHFSQCRQPDAAEIVPMPDLAPVERNGSEPARTSIGPLAHGPDRSLDAWPVRLRDAIFKPGWGLLVRAQGPRGLGLDLQQARLIARHHLQKLTSSQANKPRSRRLHREDHSGRRSTRRLSKNSLSKFISPSHQMACGFQA